MLLACPQKEWHLHTLLAQGTSPSHRNKTHLFFFLSNSFPWSNFHLCTKSQVTLLVAESFSVADVYFLIAERSLLQESPENTVWRMMLDSFSFQPLMYSTKCVPKGQDGLVIVIKQQKQSWFRSILWCLLREVFNVYTLYIIRNAVHYFVCGSVWSVNTWQYVQSVQILQGVCGENGRGKEATQWWECGCFNATIQTGSGGL